MTDSNAEKRTELSELGEFGLIDRLTKNINLVQPSTLKGVGDDAAVIDAGDQVTLVTTDQLNEGIHFDLRYVPLKHLGYKSAIVNFSDIYAMNGTPRQMVIGLSVSNRFPVEALEEIYEGILLACKEHSVDLVGGDTTSSASGLFISITVIGDAQKEKVCYRNGAKQNDLLCVSGDLGSAYMGLLLLEREKNEFLANPNMQPDLSGHPYPLERQLKPSARKDIIKLLEVHQIKPTSMIDISDGLASEIIHITTESGCGATIYEDKIPIDPSTVSLAEEFNIIPSIAALNGGEDYELLFTISLADYEKVKNIPEISVIGHITEASAGNNLISNDGASIPLKAQGWNHMSKN